MTIKIEREALLRLLSTPPFPPLLEPPIRCNNRLGNVCILKENLGCLGETRLRDDDDTASTASVSSDDTDDDDFGRGVSFAEGLVTEEWTREYTPKEDIPDLFYSTEDTQRFRQEYRLERKVLSDLSIDSGDMPADSEVFSDLVDAKCQAQARHQISRVVVLHNDKLQTFFKNDEVVTATQVPDDIPDSDSFFDKDSFWSGAVTWY